MTLLKRLLDSASRLMIVGPHPDDIEFSTGRLCIRRRGKNIHAVCMSDGRKGHDGHADEDTFADVRIAETKKALSELHVENSHFFRLPDQDIISNPYIIDRLFLLIRQTQPDYILLPPWEGAHPDHDATHIFVRIAAHNAGFDAGRIVEYASYNNYGGSFRIQQFIPTDRQVHVLTPSPNEQTRWLHIMRIFKSQTYQQEHYIPQSRDEKFRRLPEYDYAVLPYSRPQARIIRQLLSPIYPLANRLLPKKDKLFYETWSSIDPLKVKEILQQHHKEYRA